MHSKGVKKKLKVFEHKQTVAKFPSHISSETEICLSTMYRIYFRFVSPKSNGIKILAFPCDTFESNSGLQPKFHLGLLACQRNYNCQRNPTLCRGLGLEDVSITHAQVKSNPDLPYPCDLDIKLVLVATHYELRPYLLGSFL